jgi:hypothetical protein
MKRSKISKKILGGITLSFDPRRVRATGKKLELGQRITAVELNEYMRSYGAVPFPSKLYTRQQKQMRLLREKRELTA